MTPTETVKLCRMVKAICPAQAIDEFTPDVWFDLIGHLDARVAGAAVKELGQTHRFISPADITAEVDRRRREVLANTVSDSEPEWLERLEGEEHTREYLRWRRERQNRMLRGEPEPDEPPRQITERKLGPIVKAIAKDMGARRTELDTTPSPGTPAPAGHDRKA